MVHEAVDATSPQRRPRRPRPQAGVAEEAAARGRRAAKDGGPASRAGCTPSARAPSVPTWASVSRQARRPSSSWGTCAPATAASAGYSGSAGLRWTRRSRRKVADAAARLGLRHVVITSVTRDDLADGGPRHYVATIGRSGRRRPGARSRCWSPTSAVESRTSTWCLAEAPEVFNHNLETVPRLYRRCGRRRVRAVAGGARAGGREGAERRQDRLMVGWERRRRRSRGPPAKLAEPASTWSPSGSICGPSAPHLPVVE